MSSVDSINQSILDLWREFSPEDDRPPLLYPPLSEGGILFVGCNPAWVETMKLPKFSEVMADPSKSQILIQEEIKCRESYRYFAPCRDIAERLGVSWAHVDWFFIRGTKQQEVEKSLLEQMAQWDVPVKLKPFAQEQVKLAKQLMDQCAPNVVVVINALASKIARTEFALHSEQLDGSGFYRTKIGGRKVPLILSGMLPGAHALDKGSLERLKWHIEQALTERMQECPFCHGEVEKSTRYPNYVCAQCAERATDEAGREIGFSNINWEGGIKGSYNDTSEAYPLRSCFIDGHPCTASEARFGGIVITPNEK